jgi:hypothetical protein
VTSGSDTTSVGMANGGAHREAPAPIVRPVNNEGAGFGPTLT